MPVQLKRMTSVNDLEPISRVLWESFDSPPCKLRQLYFPVFGQGQEARERAIQDTIARQIEWYNTDQTSHWIIAFDTEKPGQLLGAALWHIYTDIPYFEELDEECLWFPEGEGREMANDLMHQMVIPRMLYMSRPHAFLDICFVDPKARRRGVGKLLVEWGTRKADELQIECYVDATEAGILLYEQCDFIQGPLVELRPPPITIFNSDHADQGALGSVSSQRLKELKEQLLPFSFRPMWRPLDGKFEEGSTVPPWNKCLKCDEHLSRQL